MKSFHPHVSFVWVVISKELALLHVRIACHVAICSPVLRNQLY